MKENRKKIKQMSARKNKGKRRNIRREICHKKNEEKTIFKDGKLHTIITVQTNKK